MIQFIFIIITLLSLLLFYFGTGKNKSMVAISMIWLLILGSIAMSHFFENTDAMPPRLIFALLASGGIFIYFYKTIKANKINLNYLLGIHVLRIPVELLLFQLYLQNKIPILMTFKGWNYDILVGISALCILLYILLTKKEMSKSFMILWNILGLLFLLTIVVIAILSSPLPIQQLAFDQPNIALLQFPYIYLPTFIVPIVFKSHILALKNR